MARRKEYRESEVRKYDKMKSRMYEKGGEKYGNMNKTHVSETYTSDWSEGQEGAMRQSDNGSMNYYRRKGRLDREDQKRLEREMLDQSNNQY